jgi:DNA-binding beta-propeller fold protein YncE
VAQDPGSDRAKRACGGLPPCTGSEAQPAAASAEAARRAGRPLREAPRRVSARDRRGARGRRSRAGRGAAGLVGALLLVAAAAEATAAELTLLQDGQGLAGFSRRSSDVAVSPDGRHVYASAPAWTIALRRLPDGRLARLEGEDVGEYPLNTPGARVAATADGGGVLVLVSGAGVASVVSYRRAADTGRLTFVENENANLMGSAFALAPSHDGTRVYVTSPGQDGVVVYGRDPATGALGFVQRVRQQDAGVDGLWDPNEIAVSPDDRSVYVSAFRKDGAEFRETVAWLRREGDGTLRFLGALETGPLSGSPGLADLRVTPDGAELLALDGGQLGVASAAVLRFARDPEDGRLAAPIRAPLDAPGLFAGTAAWLGLRPDGARLFVGGLSLVPTAGLVVAYARDADGALAPLDAVDVGVVSGRGAVSPDGRAVYTSAAQGVRVLVPEPRGAGAAPGAFVALILLRRLRRPARRDRARAPASGPARTPSPPTRPAPRGRTPARATSRAPAGRGV